MTENLDAALDERREQIKKAALKVFAERGISGAKMSLIAEEAGISQGLSYRYFRSKEELFTLLVQEAVEESQSAIRSLREQPGTAVERLAHFTRRMMDESHRHIFLLLQHAQRSDDVPETAKVWVNRYSPQDVLEQLVPIFIEGQQAGDFREGDPRAHLLLYFSVVTGLMLQEAPTAQGWLPEVDNLLRLIRRL